MYIFNQVAGVESIPELNYGLVYRREWEPVATRINDNVLIFTQKADWSTVSKAFMLYTGVYNQYSEVDSYISPATLTPVEKPSEDSGTEITFRTHTNFIFGFLDISVQAVIKQFDALDSYVDLGLFRLSDEKEYDRFSNIINLAIGMDDLAVGDTQDDWASLLTYPTEVIVDWETVTGDEDWGAGAAGGTDYDLILTPTIDGYNLFGNADENPEEIPNTTGKTKFYATDVQGIYHVITISAFQAFQNYEVKTIELGMNLAGRL